VGSALTIEPEFRRSSRCDSSQCVEVAFQRSSFCEDSNCVEVAHAPGEVLLRDSKDPGVVLSVSPAGWSAFLAGLKAGEFDDERRT